MNKEVVVNEIHQIIETEFDYIHSRSENRTILEQLLDKSQKFNIEDYDLFFQGSIALLERHYDTAKSLFEKSLVLNNKNVHAWGGLAEVYISSKDYTSAERCCEKGIFAKHNDKRLLLTQAKLYSKQHRDEEAKKIYKDIINAHPKDVRALYGYAIVFTKQKKFKEAIRNHKKAIGIDKNFANPWIGISYINFFKKEYKIALEYCDEAIKRNDDSPVFFDLRGSILLLMDNFEEALKSYDIALKNSERKPWVKANILKNIGQAYQKNKKYPETVKYFLKAKKVYDELGQERLAQVIDEKIKYTNQTIEKDFICRYTELSSAFSSMAFDTVPTHGLLAPDVEKNKRRELLEIAYHLGKLQAGPMGIYCEQKRNCSSNCFPSNSFIEIQNKSKSSNDEQNYFINLKGWSSNVPLLNSNDKFHSENAIRGGGYFLNWYGKGIVIDPGINFLKNFHEYGYHITDIDLVLVTHNHIDHMLDVSGICDLHREYNSQQKKQADMINIVYYLDNETRNSINDMLKIKGSTDHVLSLQISAPYDYLIERYNISLRPFKTINHDKRLKDSVGLCIDLFEPGSSIKSSPQFTLGISSDTPYSERIARELKNCDLTILHHSKTKFDDMVHQKKLPRHLGFTGISRIIEQTKADVNLISEWSANNGDNRFLFTRTWRALLNGNQKAIIPTEIGLCVKLPEKTIKCNSCLNFIAANKIILGKPDVPYGKLRYYCPACLL